MHVKQLVAVSLFLIVGGRAENSEITEPVGPTFFLKNEANPAEYTQLTENTANNAENGGKTKEPMPFA